MYLCVDPKNQNGSSDVHLKQLNFDKVGLLNNKNIKFNINEIQKSINRKYKFLSSYNEITASYATNKEKNIFNNEFETVKLKSNVSSTKASFIKEINSSKTIQENSAESNQEENYINQFKEDSNKIGKKVKLHSPVFKDIFKAKLPLLNLTPAKFSSNQKHFNFTEVNMEEEKNKIPNTVSHSVLETLKNKGHKKYLSYGNFILSDNDYNGKDFKEFRKIFDKNLNTVLEIKYDKSKLNRIKPHINEEREKFAEKTRINSQIVEMKDKLHFMKGIIDYSYPKIMIDKIKVYKDNNISSKEVVNSNKLVNNKKSIKIDKNSNPSNPNFKNFNKLKIKVLSPLHIRSMSMVD